MATYHSGKDDVSALIEKFYSDIDRFRESSYNETQVRREFLDPLFEALGWEVANSLYVVHEDRVTVEGKRVKHPDYGFRTGQDVRFYVEAKKPSVDLRVHRDPAYQVRRYGWSRKLPLSVLTDFEEFTIYNCLQKPSPSDDSHVARLRYLSYEEYVDEWDFLYGLFSYEAVLDGSLERFVDEEKPRGTITVDEAFLRELESWREVLAKDIAQQNPRLTRRQLNMAVQRTIDRLVFLRIAEDRNIEPYGRLLRAAMTGGGVYNGLKQLYIQADDKYNSGLFHFTDDNHADEGDPVSLKMDVSDGALQGIIRNLYYPNSPYEFSVLPSDILGQVYERFLGSVIVLEGGSAQVEEKPEVRKAGGVYYTPTYIVDYIVENTVGKLLEGKNPNQVSDLRVLDPACGSGSFLIGAYQYLLDWHLDYYVTLIEENPNSTYRSRVRESNDPALPWVLTTDEKKRILLNNVYGVDLDQQAVEVTKLSLLLKMLENETATSTTQYALMRTDDALLPDLADNIKWGNSLIGSDFYSGQQMAMFDDEEIYRVRAFDWKDEFLDIMRHGGFDAVIGNPPYIHSRSNLLGGDEKNYYTEHFETAQYQINTYGLFVERALQLICIEGVVGYIIPNYWLSADADSQLRDFVFIKHDPIEVTNTYNVFADATVDTLLLFVRAGVKKQFPKKIKVNSVSRNHRSISERLKAIYSRDWAFEQEYQIENDTHDTRIVFIDGIQLRGTSKLEDFVSLKFGMKPYQTGKGKPPQTPRIVKEKPFNADSRVHDGYLPLLYARDFKRYSMNWKGEWILYGQHLAEPRDLSLFEGERLLVRRIVSGDRIDATYCNTTFICNTDVLTLKLIDNSHISLLFFLGLLASKACAIHLKTQNVNLDREAFPKINTKTLSPFPIPVIDFSKYEDVAKHNHMVSLVQTMLDLHKQLLEASGAGKRVVEQRITRTEREIDTLVYKLYGLNDVEIAVIEGASK